MTPSLRSSAFLSLTVLALPATAAGLGELSLHSHIGEPLHADIEILNGNAAALGTACFSLQAIRNSELPVLTSAMLRLETRAGKTMLVITSGQPLREPLLTLRLHAGCGIQLQRDYLLMPEPPRQEAPTAVATATAPRPTLAAAPRSKTRRESTSAGRAVAKARQPPEQGDRLILDTSSLFDFTLPESIRVETEQRLLRMETDLGHLKRTMAALEQRAAENESDARLRLAPALELPAKQDEMSPRSRQPWLELLFGTLLGGLGSAALLGWLEKRRRQTGLARSTNSHASPQ